MCRVVSQHDLCAELMLDLASWRWRVHLVIAVLRVVLPVVPEDHSHDTLSSNNNGIMKLNA